MPQSRDEVIDTLAALSAPLGPFTTHQERLDRQDRWVSAGDADLFETLIDLIVSPPSSERIRDASPGDWENLLTEIAGSLGKRYPEVAMQRLLPLLDDQRARSIVIDILGSVGDARALPGLDRLVRGCCLSSEDMIRVAGALGEIGGKDACRLLSQLRVLASSDQVELLQEIDIALSSARCESEGALDRHPMS